LILKQPIRKESVLVPLATLKFVIVAMGAMGVGLS